MGKVFIDTSIFIRFLTQDNPEKFKDCQKFFELTEEGKIRPYTSSIVVLEIQFVLTRLYGFNKIRVLSCILELLRLRNLTLIEKTDTRKALALFKKLNIKYADCLIATQIPTGTKLVTYDEEFKKIPTLSPATPGDLV
ncbi:PIN domain-containing protein [Candidatus Curtissbacteria bacterium]|nr:PIN domain-containing protein [Candidatus Curtissbacteria bacterium]